MNCMYACAIILSHQSDRNVFLRVRCGSRIRPGAHMRMRISLSNGWRYLPTCGAVLVEEKHLWQYFVNEGGNFGCGAIKVKYLR